MTVRLTSRRSFLKYFTGITANIAVASTGIYVVGSAFKSLDGNLTAGAKSYQYIGPGTADLNDCNACGAFSQPNCYSAGQTCCGNPNPIPMFCEIDGSYPCTQVYRCQ